MSDITKENQADIEKIIEELREFILKDLGRAEIKLLTSEDNLFETGILDSMGTLEVINFCESSYNISFDLTSISEETFSSLRKLSDAIAGYVNAKI